LTGVEEGLDTVRSATRLLVLVGMLVALGAAPAGAQQVVDQQQTTFDGALAVGEGVSRAQTFTAGRTGTLDRVDLFLHRDAGTVEPLAVEIRDVVGGAPGNPVLAAATVPATSIPPSPGAWVPVTFSRGTPVVAGTQYAIVLYSTTADPNFYGWGFNEASLPGTGTDVYPAGQAFSSSNTPPTEWFVIHPGSDHAFKTYVTTEPSYEPSYAISIDLVVGKSKPLKIRLLKLR
jgi:hypothetical protein